MLRSLVQMQGVSSLTNRRVALRLGLTEEQKQEIQRLRTENALAMQAEVCRQSQEKKRSGNAHAILLQFHRACQERVLQVLTPEQRRNFDQLRFPDKSPVDIAPLERAATEIVTPSVST